RTLRRAPHITSLNPSSLSPNFYVRPAGARKMRAWFWNPLGLPSEEASSSHGGRPGGHECQIHPSAGEFALGQDIFYQKTGHATPFPEDAAGFLYFEHSSSNDRTTPPEHRNTTRAAPEKAFSSPSSGAVRLRLVPEPDPSLFDTGQDLRLPSGAPWGLNTLCLRFMPKYWPIYDLLRHEGLISATQDLAITRLFPGLHHSSTPRPSSSSLPSSPPPSPLPSPQDGRPSKALGSEATAHPHLVTHPDHLQLVTNSTVLNSILDPFVVDLSQLGVTATIVSEDGVVQPQFRNWTVWFEKGVGWGSPYRGSALVRFELVNVPEKTPGKKHGLKLALRILKFLVPPTPPSPSPRPSPPPHPSASSLTSSARTRTPAKLTIPTRLNGKSYIQREGELLRRATPGLNGEDEEEIWMTSAGGKVLPSMVRLLEESGRCVEWPREG
ncbi:hypothetical protein BKA70DRAFT_1267297, partial [Coprinopsis sp. MPI-PUGE-AT-0042]